MTAEVTVVLLQSRGMSELIRHRQELGRGQEGCPLELQREHSSPATPWFWRSGIQNGKRGSFSCLNHSVCGTSLWDFPSPRKQIQDPCAGSKWHVTVLQLPFRQPLHENSGAPSEEDLEKQANSCFRDFIQQVSIQNLHSARPSAKSWYALGNKTLLHGASRLTEMDAHGTITKVDVECNL